MRTWFESSAWGTALGVLVLSGVTGCGRDDIQIDSLGDTGADVGEDSASDTASDTGPDTGNDDPSTTSNDDWGDEGDDWGEDDDWGEEGGEEFCEEAGVMAYVDYGLWPAPGQGREHRCLVTSVLHEPGGPSGASFMEVALRCRGQGGGETSTSLFMEASPAFPAFIATGDRLRIRAGVQADTDGYGQWLAVERQGEGRILSSAAGKALQGQVGPSPALPFLRETEDFDCTPLGWEGCGGSSARSLIFDAPGGSVELWHQSARFGQPPGDLNVWVGSAIEFDDPSLCGQAAYYEVVMARY